MNIVKLPASVLLVCVSLNFCFFAQLAEARVFDFKSESFAFYLGGDFGSANLGQGAYGFSSGDGVSVDRSVLTQSAAEMGFVFANPSFTLRLGLEYLMPRDQLGIVGTDAAGTKLFENTSKVTAVIPELVLEFNFVSTATAHGFLGIGYGYGTVNLSNEYTITSSGQTALGVSSYKEVASGTAPMVQSSVGYEFLFTDTATCALQVGYRYMKVPSVKATQAVTAISGPETVGQDLINMGGSRRSLDLGGAFIGLNFRFYL